MNRILYAFYFVLCCALSWSSTALAEKTAVIVSCPAWTLGRNPELKTFLKGGEAEEYEGVTIEWIRGREAVMTIFEDGNEVKKIKIYEIKKKDELHDLFAKEGFQKKSQEQIHKEFRVRQAEKDIARLDQSSLHGMIGAYYTLAVVAFLAIFFIRNRTSKKSKRASQALVSV